MSRRLSLAVAAIAVAAAPTARALPPTPLTTVTASKNVHLLSNFPATGVSVGGKFAGTYYFLTSARSATYGAPDSASDGGLWVFDVKNPESPSLVSHLPLPIWENEDVDLSLKRKILLISADRKKSVSQVTTSPVLPGMLFVYDITDMAHPVLKSSVSMPASVGAKDDGTPLGGPGHIANCVLDCTYAYITGSRDRSVHVVDLRDPASPKVLGKVQTPAGADHGTWTPGIVHDVNVDPSGNVWMTGSGGTALYAPLKDPMKPVLLAATAKSDNIRTNSYIHHNSIRLNRDTVLVTEESYNGCGGEAPVAYDDPVGGRFETWRIDLKRKRLVPIAVYSQQVPGVSTCSSHWFDVNANKVVADAWYEGGVRFLDVSDPKRIRQVGYLRTSDGSASQAQFVPGRPDLVYVADYLRGLDVLKIDGGGRKAPTVSEVEVPVARTRPMLFGRSADFGYACPVPLV
ncbi:MAG TPA: hypothetical protein VF519_16065 [Mycobacteriales bacterium]|jgi:hypothetical protein